MILGADIMDRSQADYWLLVPQLLCGMATTAELEDGVANAVDFVERCLER